MTSIKLVSSTETQYSEPRHEAREASTRSEPSLVQDAFGFATAGQNINDVWREVAVYQQHAKAAGRISAVFYSSLFKWKEETEFTSSLTEIILHPAYQRIIGLGPDVVPFVLRELADNGGHWAWALRALTGDDVVPPGNEGRMEFTRQSWVRWGAERQLI